jgi:hypothetical protein
VRQSFEPEDLVEAKNVPKVAKCVEELANKVHTYTRRTTKVNTCELITNVIKAVSNLGTKVGPR